MALPHNFCADPGEGLNIHGIRMRQTHNEKGNLLQDTADLRQGKAEIDLGFSRAVYQRNKDLLLRLLDLRNRLLDLGIPAGIPLLKDTLKDPLCRVPLLLRSVLVPLDDLLYPFPEWPDLGLRSPFTQPVARWCRVFKDLLQCLPVKPGLPKHSPLLVTIHQHPFSYIRPPFHLFVHPFPSILKPEKITIFSDPQMKVYSGCRTFKPPALMPHFSTGVYRRPLWMHCTRRLHKSVSLMMR